MEEASTDNIHSILTNSIENFRDMAMRGERAIRKNNTTEGIQFLERALLIGTDDQLLLSAVYSQLGNAYFAMRNYNQARLYHMSDLNASRTLNDEAQQAKAYSNLSATYSMLIEYENAILCATNVISIGKKLSDAMIECRGHYNLGLAHLNYAISMQSSDYKENFEFGDHGQGLKKQEHLQKSLDEFELSLNIAEEHNDCILCGLALGNIANAYFHALNYRKAIEYHEKRLLIARELGDKTSIRRTLTNIAKAKILLGELYEGRESYSAALDIAREMKLPVEIIAKLESEITNATSLIDNIVKREVYSPSSVGTNAPKSLCDAGTSPFSDSTVERLCKSTTQLDIMGNNKPKRQLKFAELFRSDRKARNDDFFDMIDKMQGKRIEDQRAEFPSSIQMDSRSVNIDFANSSNSSSNHGLTRGIGNLKRGTIKSLSNMKSKMTSKLNKN